MDAIQKNFALYVDGRYASGVTDFTPPKLTIKTEDVRAGGMDTTEAIDQGMEKLETSYVIHDLDPEIKSLLGFRQGGESTLVVRTGVQSRTGGVTAHVHTMNGKLREIDQGTFKAGEKVDETHAWDIHYYKLEIGGRVIHEIDVRNFIRTIDGVDQLAEMRAALGR